MRVAVAAESFLPHVNGVTNSVIRVLRHLRARGHEAKVWAPAMHGLPAEVEGFEVVGLPSVPMPGYPQVRFCLTPDFLLHGPLSAYAPDVVHLASPLVLGYEAGRAAHAVGLPTVAIYQTEVTSYAERYGVPQLEALLWWRLRNLHGLANRTLVPSSFSAEQLAAQGIPRLHRWGRGVDLEQFNPAHRSDAWRAQVAPAGETIIGYVGRLAPEKNVENLAALAGLPGTKLVIIGDGPSEPELHAQLPDAVFLGRRTGAALGEAMASFDLFVHTGELETFGQTIQEAHASGLAVVAPRRGGPVDLIREGVDGSLYAPGDTADLRACVERWLADPAALAEGGRRGRESVADRDWASVCDELIAHHEAAAAEGVHSIGP